MIKKVCTVVLCLLLFLFLAAPSPPNLPSSAGVVKTDYADQSSIRKVTYTMVQPNGIMKETWSKDEEIQKRVDRAASEKRTVTVWYQTDGEIYAIETQY